MKNHAAERFEQHALNRRFIHDFVTRDVASHDALLHPRFHCTTPRGARMGRAAYLDDWATAFDPAVLRVLAFAVAAAVLYGAVGALSNRMHGNEAMWRAALVQGGASALTTATLSSLINLMLAWLRKRAHEGHVFGSTRSRRAPLAVGLSAAVLGALVHVGLNWWAATPELFMTVAVPAIGLLAYGPLYALAAQARATGPQRGSVADVPCGASMPRL